MTASVDVLLTKEEISPERIGASVVVVLDVLLATTTIAYALHRGMPRVLAVAGASAARAAADARPDDYLFAGEWLGRPIPSFAPIDPRRWAWPDCAQRSLIFSSTNGTVALASAWRAKELYAGAFVNADAVARHAATRDAGDDVLLVCAGSSGRFAFDDFLAAGCIVERLSRTGAWLPSDAALAALAAYRAHSQDIAAALRLSRTGRWLEREGFGDLVELAAGVDRMPAVARREEGWLVRA